MYRLFFLSFILLYQKSPTLEYKKQGWFFDKFYWKFFIRILVAEDDLDNAGLLENILKKNEHTVKVVPDCAKALQRLRDEKLDWMMPEMDGITLIQRVRDEVESAPLILMITAISVDDTRQQEMEVGADDFLIKPYRSTDVVRVLSDGLAPLN